MMGERGGAAGYSYANPYEQPAFSPAALPAHHHPHHAQHLPHHQEQDKGDPYAKLDPYATIKQDPYESSKSDPYQALKSMDPYGAGKSVDPYHAAVPKTDPYGSLVHMRNSEFFNHNLVYQQAAQAQQRAQENNHLGYESAYKYHEKPVLDMRVQERINNDHYEHHPRHHEQPAVVPHPGLDHREHKQDNHQQQQHHHQQQQQQPQQQPYGQFPSALFFPHFLQNIRDSGAANMMMNHQASLKQETERYDPRRMEQQRMSIPPEHKPPPKPKVPRPRKTELNRIKEEIGDGDIDNEEVPDHEKVFTDSIEEMCQCLCKICNTTMKFRSLREHVRFQHSMNIQSYKEKYGNIYTRLTYHKCRLCEKVTKASYDFLNNHVSKVHKMSFAQYRLKFDIFKGRSKKIFKGETQTDSENKIFTDKLDEMCLCKCEICQSQLEPYNMRHHCKSKHNMGLDEYRDKYGEIAFSRETYHRCKLCHKEIVFEYQKLSSHLYSGHSLGISKYINLFLSASENSTENENKEISAEHCCKICGSTFPSNKFRYHLQSEHSLNTRRYEEQYGHINDFQYKSSDDIADMCTFKCKICQNIIQAQDFSNHLVTDHEMTLKSYRSTHGKLAFDNKTFHRCKECDRDILFTITAIKRHLETKHGITFKKYRLKHSVFVELKETVPIALGKGRKKRNEPLKLEPTEEEVLKAPEGSRFSTELADMVTYQCGLCKEVMQRIALKKHFPKEHSMSFMKYINRNGEMQPTENIYHRCKLCSSELIFDKEILHLHLKNCHGISFPRYKNDFGAFTDYKPPAAVQAARYKEKAAAAGLPAGTGRKRGRPRIHFRSTEDRDTAAAAQPDHNDAVIPVCKYQCQECPSVFNRRQLIKHIIKVHKIPYREYRDKHGPHVPLSKLHHSCRICQVRLLACYDTIKSHIRDKHNLAFSTYRTMCEALGPDTEFNSSDILDNPTLANALNIKTEPGENEDKPDVKPEVKQEDDSDDEFDHEDIMFAMSVEYKEAEKGKDYVKTRSGRRREAELKVKLEEGAAEPGFKQEKIKDSEEEDEEEDMDTTKEEEPDEDDEQLEDQIEEAEVDTSFEEELLDSGRGEDVGQENKEDTSMEEDDVMKEAEEEESNVNGRHEMLPQTDQGVEDNHVRGGAELAEEGEERVHDKMEVAAGNGQLHHFYNVDQTENEDEEQRPTETTESKIYSDADADMRDEDASVTEENS